MKKKVKKFFTAILVGLAIIAFWRGAWNLMNELVFPQDPILSNMVTMFAGLIVLAFSHHLIQSFLYE